MTARMSINDPRIPEAGTLLSIMSYVVAQITLSDAAFIASIIVSACTFYLMIDKLWAQTMNRYKQFTNWNQRRKKRKAK